MFVKGHKHSPEMLAKIVAKNTGKKRSKPSWQRGLTKETDERVARMAAAKTGKKYGPRPHRRGISVSVATEIKKGEHLSKATEFKKGAFIREKNPSWRGGVTTKNDFVRKSCEYKEWRTKVYQRDGFACQDCGVHCEPKNIIAHHLKEFADYPELRFDVDNGLTLCRTCHFNRHHHKEKRCELVA